MRHRRFALSPFRRHAVSQRAYGAIELGKLSRFSLLSPGGMSSWVMTLPAVVGKMNNSKSVIAVALQIAACAGLLPKDAKANPTGSEAGENTKIGTRVARVRQMLSQTATEHFAGQRDVNGVKVNWWNWHKGWHKGGWGNGSWGNGGWGNGPHFHPKPGWGNGGWGNGGWGKMGWLKWYNY
jgi:rSAM-associated Gly-rich repeat protein